MFPGLPDNLGEELADTVAWTSGELVDLRALTEAELDESATLTRGDLLALVNAIDTLSRMAIGMVGAAGQLAAHPVLGRLLLG